MIGDGPRAQASGHRAVSDVRFEASGARGRERRRELGSHTALGPGAWALRPAGFTLFLTLLAAGPGFEVLPVAEQSPAAAATPRSASDGVFTEAQAKRGATVYLRECSVCHGDALDGGEGTPPLVGSDFEAFWYGQTVGDLFDMVRTSMPPPPDVPGRLTSQQYADVVAYILEFHGFPAGASELPTETEALMRIRLDRKE